MILGLAQVVAARQRPAGGVVGPSLQCGALERWVVAEELHVAVLHLQPASGLEVVVRLADESWGVPDAADDEADVDEVELLGKQPGVL